MRENGESNGLYGRNGPAFAKGDAVASKGTVEKVRRVGKGGRVEKGDFVKMMAEVQRSKKRTPKPQGVWGLSISEGKF